MIREADTVGVFQIESPWLRASGRVRLVQPLESHAAG